VNWPKYPEYKYSGTDWLGAIPDHWSTTKLKWSTSMVTSGSRGWAQYYADEGDYFVRIGNLSRGALDFDDSDVHYVQIPPGAEGARTMTRTGDLLFSITAYLGSVAVVDAEHAGAYVSQHVALARLNGHQLDPWYAAYVALSNPGQRQLSEQAYGGTKIQLSLDDIRSLVLPLPNAEEQRLIVKFLDRETAQIDALIAKQEQLIATLREDRQAQLINLVAHGCNPATAMKSCGLGWVEDVPRDWDVLNIRRVAQMKTGHTPSRAVAEYWEDTTIPWFTLADVWQLRDGQRTYLGETNDHISELGLANSAAELLPAGTVVLSRTASVGFTGIMPEPMATSQDFWNWVCGPQIIPEYLMYTFRAMHSYFSSLMMGSTHKTIYQADAAAIRIPLPPVSDQRGIVRQVISRTAAVDGLIQKAVQVIDILREYRSGLITDAVTGKIDVQGAA
jgi:type I restriction enzyme S subunit